VTASTRSASAGPMAQQVTVPGASWVRPASVMTWVGRPAALGGGGKFAQLSVAADAEHYLRLPVGQPAGQVGAAVGGELSGKHRGDGGVRDLGSQLAPPHAEVRPDHQGKLRCHPSHPNAAGHAGGRCGRLGARGLGMCAAGPAGGGCGRWLRAAGWLGGVRWLRAAGWLGGVRWLRAAGWLGGVRNIVLSVVSAGVI